MPQLSTDTKDDGSNVSERDLERSEREKSGRQSPQAQHEIEAKPIYEALRKVVDLGDYTITCRYRSDSPAHVFDALDVKAKDLADDFKLAGAVSKVLGKDYMVQVEEALPNGKQKNTIYSGGKQVRSTIGPRAKNFTGTHVHIQTERSRRPHVSQRGDRDRG